MISFSRHSCPGFTPKNRENKERISFKCSRPSSRAEIWSTFAYLESPRSFLSDSTVNIVRKTSLAFNLACVFRFGDECECEYDKSRMENSQNQKGDFVAHVSAPRDAAPEISSYLVHLMILLGTFPKRILFKAGN